MTLIQYDVFLCSIVLSSACELLTTLTCNPERWIGPGTRCLFSGDLCKQHCTHPRASVLLALAAISCLHDVSGVCLHDVRGVGDHCCKVLISSPIFRRARIAECNLGPARWRAGGTLHGLRIGPFGRGRRLGVLGTVRSRADRGAGTPKLGGTVGHGVQPQELRTAGAHWLG